MGDRSPASVWLVDKPSGPTSHDVVATARRQVGRGVRVGHGGTLDPFATGLLVVLVGRATRLAQFVSGLDKTYVADVRLGASSATGDPEGPVVPSGDPPPRDVLAAALERFLGGYEQSVPALSAVKVEGERLYRRTRRGERVAPPKRRVRIEELELLDGPDADGLARLRARVGAGTYIRQLASDIGEALGCGAFCERLRRTRIGRGLRIEDACAPDDVREAGGIPPMEAIGHLPRRELSPAEAAQVVHGRPVPGDETASPVALVHEGRLCAVARWQDSRLQPVVVMG